MTRRCDRSFPPPHRVWEFIAVLVSLSAACSTFSLGGPACRVFGKSYDYDIGDGLLVVNKRGVAKTAVADTNPARWTSRFGSVTFNQFGRELPSGGMNEEGLVVELMWLSQTRYPAPDARAAIGQLEWIQYQLDNHRSVEEVLASDTLLRIYSRARAPIHYLVCDRLGKCATVEFINGRGVFHSGGSLTAPVLTNDPYAVSAQHLRSHRGFGGTDDIPSDNGSLSRFVRIAAKVRDYDPRSDGSAPEYAFSILKSVSMGTYSKWNIVYDQKYLRVHFRTQENRRVRRVDLDALDFSCATPVLIADVNARGSGEITANFAPYTTAANRDLVERVFHKVDFLSDLPPTVREQVWRYPETTTCNP